MKKVLTIYNPWIRSLQLKPVMPYTHINNHHSTDKMKVPFQKFIPKEPLLYGTDCRDHSDRNCFKSRVNRYIFYIESAFTPHLPSMQQPHLVSLYFGWLLGLELLEKSVKESVLVNCS